MLYPLSYRGQAAILRQHRTSKQRPRERGRCPYPAIRPCLGDKELAKRLNEPETRIERKLTTHDQAIAGILDAIRQLMVSPPSPKKRPIGFVIGEK